MGVQRGDEGGVGSGEGKREKKRHKIQQQWGQVREEGEGVKSVSEYKRTE